jgi:hypothetical protein
MTRLGMPTSEGAGAGWLAVDDSTCLPVVSGIFADVREDVEEVERGYCVYSVSGGCEFGITLLRPRIAASCNPSALGTLEP